MRCDLLAMSSASVLRFDSDSGHRVSECVFIFIRKEFGFVRISAA